MTGSSTSLVMGVPAVLLAGATNELDQRMAQVNLRRWLVEEAQAGRAPMPLDELLRAVMSSDEVPFDPAVRRLPL